MSVVQEACPSCAAPLQITGSVTRIKCPYCATSLAVQRRGSEVALEAASAITTSIEKSGIDTQSELRRLQITQELSMAQMRLASVQGEIRAIERLPATPITRKQLAELRGTEAELQRQIQSLQDILNLPTDTPTASPAAKARTTSNELLSNLPWLLFSPTGRATRSQYWIGIVVLFVLFTIIRLTTATTIDPVTGDSTADPSFISSILMLAFLWVGFAVSAKRYHDRGKAAWWVFIALVPVIGVIWQFVELGFLPGDPGPNQYA